MKIKKFKYKNINSTNDIAISLIKKKNIRAGFVLTEKHYEVYEDLFVKNLSEDEVAKKLGYTTNEKNRKAGYKQIKNLKKMFKEKAVTVIKQKDIIIVNDWINQRTRAAN